MERKRVLVRENASDMEEEPIDEKQSASKLRTIRSYYRQIGNKINEEKEELENMHSGKFLDIMNEVENIHQHVNKPREQVADAETLLGLTRTLVACAKTHTSGDVTPAQFVSSLITQFGQRKTTKEKSHNVSWKTIGSFASPIFKNGKGCTTMIGPMNNELKLRKVYARRKRPNLTRKARPKMLEKVAEEATDTVTNASEMYDVLRKVKKVKVENLILNRHSFAQTVENLFTLSFLVKDGRVVLEVDENGSHFAALRNGPSAKDIRSGEVKYHQFIFRFDFNDWELMKSVVVEGEEVMASRPSLEEEKAGAEAEAETIPSDCELTCTTLSVKKSSTNFKTFMANWLSCS